MKYQVEDSVVCTFGTNKGKDFVIKVLLKNDFYSCQLKDGSDDKFYLLNKSTIRKP